jgi:hypothetical protein
VLPSRRLMEATASDEAPRGGHWRRRPVMEADLKLSSSSLSLSLSLCVCVCHSLATDVGGGHHSSSSHVLLELG